MGGKPPGPSKEERNLQTAQRDSLLAQQRLLENQYREQSLLAPILYKQNNIRPVYENNGHPVNRGNGLEPAQIIGFEDLGPTPEQQAYQELLKIQTEGAKTQQETARYNQALQRLELQGQGYDIQTDAEGNPTGLTLRPGSIQALQEETSRRLLERQNQALSGTLPVDPALQQQFDRSDAVLAAQLRSNLGTGYETSTPGIQALAQARQDRESAIYAAQHGEIGYAGQLAAQSRASGTDNSAFNILERSLGQSQYLNSFAQAGSPAARSAQLIGTIQSPYAPVDGGQGGGFGTLAELYGQAAQGSRRPGGPVKNRGVGALSGALSGAAAGATAGSAIPVYGTAIGAGVGAIIGGVGGYYS